MITYRKAASSDIHELVFMRMAFIKEAQKKETDEQDEAVRAALIDYFNRTLSSGEFVAWLAYDEDELVGTSGLCFYSLPPSYKNVTGKVAYIMNMYTLPSHRKMGIAGALFERVFNEAKEAGVSRVSLNATQMGRPLYENRGFIDTHNEMIFNF